MTMTTTIIAEGAEELFIPPEVAEGEEVSQSHVGFLPGCDGKFHSCLSHSTHPPLSQKCTTLLSKVSHPKTDRKTFDSKGEARPLSYPESAPIRTKHFHVQRSEAKAQTESKQKTSTRTSMKTDQTARRSFETAKPSPSSPYFPSFSSKEKTESPRFEKKTPHSEEKRPEKTEKREQKERQYRSKNQKSGEREKLEELQKQKCDQEEGFVEKKWEEKEKNNPDDRENSKVGAIDTKGIDPKEFISYAAEESSQLSKTLNIRVSHFDVLILFIEIMKLFLKSQEQERLSRKQERALQLEHMQNMVENYKQQSKSFLTSSLGSGFFALISGITPIFGFLYGEQAVNLGGLLFNRLRNIEKADRDKLFEALSKITQTLSDVQKSYGEIQKTFAQSSLVFDQHMAEIHKADWEEDTRSMEAIKENWKNLENFIYQTLQMHHEAVQHLHK